MLTILNHDEKPVRLRVRIEAASDFADLFEVKDALKKKGRYANRVERGALRLGYERETFRRWTLISSSERAKVDENGLTFELRIPAHGEWTTELDVVVGIPGYGAFEARKGGRRKTMEANLDRWLAVRPAHRRRLGAAEADVQPQPRRPRRAAVRAARHRRPEPAGGRACPGS